MTKSTVSCGFGNIYWRNPQSKTSFFDQWKISSTCAGQMLCLDYSNQRERRNISKLYMIARGHLFPTYIWSWKCMCLTVFSTRERCSNRNIIGWVKIKYLGAIQNRCGQRFCLRDNAFSQYTPAFASAIVVCWRQLERLYIYSIYNQISLYSKYSDLNTFSQNA